MFRRVRDWLNGEKSRHATRLFLFEYVVVVAGVLTAQALADWVASRSERQAVTEEDARVRYEIGRARQNARVWLVAIPCLDARAAEIIRGASAGTPTTADQLRFPQVIGYTVEPIASELDRPFRKRFGISSVDTYANISSATKLVVENYRDLGRNWDRLALLDPSLGTPSEADRTTARDVGVQIRSQLRRAVRLNQAIEEMGGRLGIAPLTSTAENGQARPIQSCTELWRTGKIWRE